MSDEPEATESDKTTADEATSVDSADTPTEKWVWPDMKSGIDFSMGVKASDVDAIRKAAYQEGFAQGLEEGAAQGMAQADEKIKTLAAPSLAHIQTILENLSAPLAEFGDELKNNLIQTALLLAKQVVRHDISINAELIQTLIQELVVELPISSKQVTLFINPEDAELVQACLPQGDQQTWQIQTATDISRGGCRLVAEHSQIDATVEARLQAVIEKFWETHCSELSQVEGLTIDKIASTAPPPEIPTADNTTPEKTEDTDKTEPTSDSDGDHSEQPDPDASQ